MKENMENTIKVILFDLDGVIVDTKNLHYISLNKALIEYDKKFIISEEENLETYDGLKTQVKLNILTNTKKLPIEAHQEIFDSKQKYTFEAFSKIKSNKKIANIFKTLKNDGYILGCCTNNNKTNTTKLLDNLNITKYLDIIMTYDDVINGKPHPEIYWNALSKLKSLPTQTLIIEDSKQGVISAKLSGSFVLEVKSANDVTLKSIYSTLKFIEQNY